MSPLRAGTRATYSCGTTLLDGQNPPTSRMQSHSHALTLVTASQDTRKAHKRTRQNRSASSNGTSLPHRFCIASAPLPHRFHIASTPLPHRFRTASTSLPHRFCIASAPLPHRFHTASTSLPHRFCIASAPLLHRFRTASAPLTDGGNAQRASFSRALVSPFDRPLLRRILSNAGSLWALCPPLSLTQRFIPVYNAFFYLSIHFFKVFKRRLKASA